MSTSYYPDIIINIDYIKLITTIATFIVNIFIILPSILFHHLRLEPPNNFFEKINYALYYFEISITNSIFLILTIVQITTNHDFFSVEICRGFIKCVLICKFALFVYFWYKLN